MKQNLIQLKYKVQILKFTLQGKLGATAHFARQRMSALSGSMAVPGNPRASVSAGSMQD